MGKILDLANYLIASGEMDIDTAEKLMDELGEEEHPKTIETQYIICAASLTEKAQLMLPFDVTYCLMENSEYSLN